MNRGHGSGRGCDGKHASTGDGARPEGGRARAASAGRRLGINTRMLRLIRSNNCARARPPLPPASRLAILFALLNPLAHSLQPPGRPPPRSRYSNHKYCIQIPFRAEDVYVCECECEYVKCVCAPAVVVRATGRSAVRQSSLTRPSSPHGHSTATLLHARAVVNARAATGWLEQGRPSAAIKRS